MLCIVAKQYILQQKCLNKWLGSDPNNNDFTTFNTYTDPEAWNSPPLAPQTLVPSGN